MVDPPINRVAQAWNRTAPRLSASAWLHADYLLWSIKSAPNPVPLVTTGPFNPDTYTGSPIPAALGSRWDFGEFDYRCLGWSLGATAAEQNYTKQH